MIIDAVNKIDVSINVGRTEGMKQLHTKEGWKVEKIQITIRIWIAV